jgi:hypothetical protein
VCLPGQAEGQVQAESDYVLEANKEQGTFRSGKIDRIDSTAVVKNVSQHPGNRIQNFRNGNGTYDLNLTATARSADMALEFSEMISNSEITVCLVGFTWMTVKQFWC